MIHGTTRGSLAPHRRGGWDGCRLMMVGIAAAGCPNRAVPDRTGGETGAATTGPMQAESGGDESGSSALGASVDSDASTEMSSDDGPREDCTAVGSLPNGCLCDDSAACYYGECNAAVGRCVAPGCQTGEDGCRCTSTGACKPDLECVSGYCIDPSCPTGLLGCTCLPVDVCIGGAACADDRCR